MQTRIRKNGVSLLELSKKQDFDRAVYDTVGEKDSIGILKFSSDTHCNVVLSNKIGNLAAQYEYIYAIVWRKTRK